MNLPPSIPAPETSASRGGVWRRAVTILELLVAVSLISFIILALYQMFDRTQTQMRRAVREVDKFESGRAAAELIQRDLALMVAARSPAGNAGVNFFVGTNWSRHAFAMTNNVTNVIQQNALHDLLFASFDLSPAGQSLNWGVVAYRVAESANVTFPAVTTNSIATNGLGTLYRWSTNGNRFSTNLQWRLLGQNPPAQHWQRVAENVVHFRVIGITNGVPVPPAGYLTNSDLPSRVEIELGFMDTRTAERARAFLPNTNAMRAYLSTNVDSVHMFRLNIPIRAGLQ